MRAEKIKYFCIIQICKILERDDAVCDLSNGSGINLVRDQNLHCRSTGEDSARRKGISGIDTMIAS